jgi:flagellar hook-associated protein 3 FlgL
MNLTSIGDLAHSLMLRRQSTSLKEQITVLTQELSTGQVSDITARTGGDFTYLSDIESNLTLLGSYRLATSEASMFAEASQEHLGRLQDLVSGFSSTLTTTQLTSQPAAREHAGREALAGLETAISTMNGTVAGRSLFAGVSTDQAPLAGADELMAELRLELNGLSTINEIRQAVDDWFADPSGFDAAMYRGSDRDLSPMQVSATENVSMSIRADNTEFRDVLKSLVLPALAMDDSLGLPEPVQAELMQAALENTLNADGKLTTLRADLGYAESRIEEAATRNAAAQTSLEIARNNILGADLYDTAVRLEEAQFQLESLYAVTARSARLSLLSHLS